MATAALDSTAVRVALWRALHVEVDAPPHVLKDVIGLRLAAPEDGWRQRPNMHPEGTRLFRASIVARARFIEDLVVEQRARGVDQYVLLGAGLDMFVQRRPEAEVRSRRLRGGEAWSQKLVAAGFDAGRPAIVTSTGVSMYLSREAIMAMLHEVAALAPGTTFAMTFLLPLEMAEPAVRPGMEMAEKGARASGTPFISFFMPAEMMAMAREAGFREARHVSAANLTERYFKDRPDGLRPPLNAEELLAATT